MGSAALARRSVQPAPADLAVQLLVGSGEIAGTAAARWAEAGLVYLYEGLPLIASPWTNPLDGAVELYLAFVHPRLRGDGELMQDLLSACDNTWQAEYAVARLPAEEEADSPLVLRARYISKTPRQTQVEPDSRFDIRLATAKDHAFVVELLARSFVAGYMGRGRRVKLGRARAVARQHLNDDVSCLVAASGERQLGYAAWIRDTDEISERSFDELIDVNAIDSHRGRGVIATLTAAVERAVAANQGTILGHVTSERNGTGDALYEELRFRGWYPEYSLWETALGAVRPSVT